MAYMNMTLHEAHALDKSVAGREVSYHLLFYHFSPFLLSLLTSPSIPSSLFVCLSLFLFFLFFFLKFILFFYNLSDTSQQSQCTRLVLLLFEIS